jgi:ketopantoate hydroxymethyltransferase
LRNLYTNKTPIAVVTAHDFPSGLIADLAGVDVVLVGDSLAMVALGMEVSFEIYRWQNMSVELQFQLADDVPENTTLYRVQINWL